MTTTIHDSGYKKLFSNRTIFRQLIESFVDEEWVTEIDFSQCETLDKSFVSDHYKATESDLIYKVTFRGHEAYLVILLEFQSTVERFMALRVLNYLTNFYMDYVETTDKVRMLPPVFPILLYNGKERWTAPVKMETLIQDVKILKQYAPRFQYCTIIEREYSKEMLLTIRNIVSTLFLTEGYYDESGLVIDELVNIFEQEDDRRAAELLINWFRMLVKHGYFPAQAEEELNRKFHSSQEVRSMLVEALAEERKRLVEQDLQKVREESREEGREEGLFEGLLSGIATVLEMKFGDTGMQNMQDIAHLHDVAALQELMEVIKRSPSYEDVMEFVTAKQTSLHN